MARTRKTRRSTTNRKSTTSKTTNENEKNQDVEEEKMIVEEEKISDIEEVKDDTMIIEDEPTKLNSDDDNVDEETKNNENEDDTKENNEESSPKTKPKKKVIEYPEEIINDERYVLFLKLYRDRGSVDDVVAEAVKELKKQRNKMFVQMFSLIFYLSNLKMNKMIKFNSSISSLTITDMIFDSQENHFLPFSTFSKRSKSSFSYTIQFRRVFAFWCGIGRNFFTFREETSQHLLEFLIELTTYNHRNLRFVATSCVLGILQGFAEIEKESQTVCKTKGKKKGTNYEVLLKNCEEVKKQLYDQVICHRIRDIFTPIRVLLVVVLILAMLASSYPSSFNQDMYIKYIGLSLGDSDSMVRLEAVRGLIELVEENWNEDVCSLLKRYKQRILFMSRDQQPIIIIAIIRLIDLMNEKELVTEEENELIYELAVDIDRSIAHRAFSFLSKYSLHQDESKTNSTDHIDKNKILVKVLQYLEKYASDDEETNHVYYFVKNCASSTTSLVDEKNIDVLNIEGMVQLLLNQQLSYGLNMRQLILLSVLLKATVQLFHDNHDEDPQSQSYNQYTTMNEIMVNQIEKLLAMYKTDLKIEMNLVNLIEYLQFPSIQAIEGISMILIELFKNETDLTQGNHLLFILSHLDIHSQESSHIPIQKYLHSSCLEILQKWSDLYKQIATKLLLVHEENEYHEIEETCHSLCVVLSQLVNIYCYSDETPLFQEKGLFSDIELVLMDIKNTEMRPLFIEIRCYCKRLKQLNLLYQYYALKNMTGSVVNISMDDVKADTQLLLESIQEDMKYLSEYVEKQENTISSSFFVLLTIVCDLLIVADDSLLNENNTQLVGEITRCLLLGYHDSEISDSSEVSITQQRYTKQVLTPVYQVSLAHINTIFPSCLFYYLTNYGSISYELCKGLFKAAKEVNIHIVYRLILDSLQYAFSSYKLNRMIIHNQEKNQQVCHDQFISNAKKLASFLGIQLNYDSLVSLFDMIKEAIQFVTSTKKPEMIEFFEGLIPFVPKLTKEAKDFLLEELNKSIQQYEEDVRQVLETCVQEEKEREEKYACVFLSFYQALKKEKMKKTANEKKEKEKGELMAIAPKSRKREQPDKTKKNEPKSKKSKKNEKK